MLSTLKDLDSPAYSSLAQKFKHYASCVGLVDTGYFRKRSEEEIPFSNNIGPPPSIAMDTESRETFALNAALHDLRNLEHLLHKIHAVKEELEKVKSGLLTGHHACNYIACPKPTSKRNNRRTLPSTLYKDFLSKYFDSVRYYDDPDGLPNA